MASAMKPRNSDYPVFNEYMHNRKLALLILMAFQ